jgi:hypothetical protein
MIQLRFDGIVLNRFRSIRSILSVVSVITLCGCTAEQKYAEGGGWIDLFNGRDLNDWTVKVAGYELNDNPGNLFRVEDGKMIVSYDQFQKFGGQFGHIFYKDKFSHYKLRLEYRVVGEQLDGGPGWGIRNNGIMIHSQPPQTMRRDQDFPVSIEVQLLGGDGEHERTTGNLCTPGTHVVMDGDLISDHCTNSNSKTYHGEQWVKAEVHVHGNDVIKHFINDELVMEYEQPQLDESDTDARKLLGTMDKMLSEGYIALQAESHPFEFRNVQLLELEK